MNGWNPPARPYYPVPVFMEPGDPYSGMVLSDHDEYQKILNEGWADDDILTMPIERLAKLSRVYMCVAMTEEMIEWRAQRFRDVILQRLDAEPEFAGLTEWPARYVQSIIGNDPRLIPGVRITQGKSIRDIERLNVLSTAHPICFEYVNRDDVREWVISAPWTEGNQVRPLSIDGIEIMSWNRDVGYPA